MNREIKFRVWNIKEKGMFDATDSYCPLNTWTDRPDNFTVMQYTGLKDKNGKEIYDGDIIIAANGEVIQICFGEYYHLDSGVVDGHTSAIGFYGEAVSESGFCRESFGKPFGGHKYEVIGNIYENPELLK